MKKKPYKTVPVQSVDVTKLRERLGSSAIVAIDVAKVKMAVGFADASGGCVEIVRFDHPNETRLFLELLKSLRSLNVDLEVVLEPTGVYGDALRHQLVTLGFSVFRMDAKKVHDAAEVFDGVPSLHDAKACMLLARLHTQGLSKPWRERSENERDLRALVDERDVYARTFERNCGQLEAVVARYWPELSEHVERSRGWHLHLLSTMPGPLYVAEKADLAAQLLYRVSRSGLAKTRIEELIGLAQNSLGKPMTAREADYIRALTSQMIALRKSMADVDLRIDEEVARRPALAMFAKTFGPVTAAVVFADAGDPASYASAHAFEKALGLNLKVRSSGENQGLGTIGITKRGPSRVRQYLFLAALRFIASNAVVKLWYQSRSGYRAQIKLKAVVAVMRKIARSMVHVARGEPFDAEKLFDIRRLHLQTAPAPHHSQAHLSAV